MSVRRTFCNAITRSLICIWRYSTSHMNTDSFRAGSHNLGLTLNWSTHMMPSFYLRETHHGRQTGRVHHHFCASFEITSFSSYEIRTRLDKSVRYQVMSSLPLEEIRGQKNTNVKFWILRKKRRFFTRTFFEGKFHVMSHAMSGYFWSKKRSKIRTL